MCLNKTIANVRAGKAQGIYAMMNKIVMGKNKFWSESIPISIEFLWNCNSRINFQDWLSDRLQNKLGYRSRFRNRNQIRFRYLHENRRLGPNLLVNDPFSWRFVLNLNSKRALQMQRCEISMVCDLLVRREGKGSSAH